MCVPVCLSPELMHAHCNTKSQREPAHASACNDARRNRPQEEVRKGGAHDALVLTLSVAPDRLLLRERCALRDELHALRVLAFRLGLLDCSLNKILEVPASMKAQFPLITTSLSRHRVSVKRAKKLGRDSAADWSQLE
jgi:hypothetical protein